MKITIKMNLGVLSRDIVVKVIRCDHLGPRHRLKEANFNDNLRKNSSRETEEDRGPA